LEARLALRQRPGSPVLAPGEEKVEGEVHEILRAAFRECRLQGGEVGGAGGVDDDDFTIKNAVRQRACRLGGGAGFGCPVESLACPQGGFPTLHSQLYAIAVELDLVDPVAAGGRCRSGLTKLRRNKARHHPARYAIDLAWRRDRAGLVAFEV